VRGAGVGGIDREQRYRKADEFLQVVKKLWLSWDTPEGPAPDGPLWNETTARAINHHGECFEVRGPLNVPIGPQGHPVISQAGASPQGIDFAGKHAEIVYAALLSKEAAFQFKGQLESAAAAHPEPVNRSDFGLTWNQLGMSSTHNIITVHAVFTRA
jgi:alkanesulfonate monooxygenase SsuD/methylene tetrahydromethanopterin reductase-like flavin-dependent oxidoreductase (luciferase family)